LAFNSLGPESEQFETEAGETQVDLSNVISTLFNPSWPTRPSSALSNSAASTAKKNWRPSLLAEKATTTTRRTGKPRREKETKLKCNSFKTNSAKRITVIV